MTTCITIDTPKAPTATDNAYGARPIKRNRRTGGEMVALKIIIIEVASEIAPATVRQIYYALVCRGVIEKTEAAYRSIGRLLTIMRRAGEIPFAWLTDNTRWQRKPETFDGISQLLNDTAQLYRRSVWSTQDAYVEVWLEKDALSGVLYNVTAKWDVPLMVTRGYPSVTFVHAAAEAIDAIGKPTHLYYFGDKDPSGIDIPRKVEEGIREFAPDAEVYFNRVAVTDNQIEKWKLPTRPTKKSDSRSKSFIGESVELDAIPPDRLRWLVNNCIESHIDQRALEKLKIAETSEREWLANIAVDFDRGQL